MTLNFSKNDTLVVKGIAIIFLVFYHCLSSVDRLCGYDVSFGLMPQKTAMFIFESMNICVGMFAFLSSYGLTKSILLKYKTLDLDKYSVSDFLSKRTISLLGSFFIPYVICVVPTFLFTDYNPYGKDISFVFNLLADMLGISGIIGSQLMIGTWWYMGFALVIIFLMPLTVKLYQHFGIFCVVPFIIIPVLLNPNFFSSKALVNMTRWLLTIPMGVIFADLKIFERSKETSPTKNKILGKLIKFIVLTVVLVILVIFRRTNWCEKYFFYFISSILPVYFIYYVYEFICGIPIINMILAFLGKHSSNIFFIHTFVRYIWFKDITYSLGNWFLIFGFVLGTSLILSIAVIIVQKLVRWDKFTKFLSNKTSKLCGKLLEADPVNS